MVVENDHRVEAFMDKLVTPGETEPAGGDEPESGVVEMGGALHRGLLPWGVIGLLVIIILILGFRSCSGPSMADLKGIQSKVEALERRLDVDSLVEVNKRFVQLESEVSSLQASLEQANRTVQSLARQVEDGQRKVAGGQKAAVRPAPLPKPKPSTATAAAALGSGSREHTVAKGDTLYGISRRYGLTVDQLCRLNNIRPNHTIRPGDRLTLGKGPDS